MATNNLYTLEARASQAIGAAFRCAPMRDKTVQVAGVFTATLQLEGSLDGTTWTALGTAFTAPGIRHIPESVHWIRVNTTLYTDGTPSVKLAGFPDP